ncbi:hypothetical protein [Acinetobacter ursingii]|uniref:hypothetical protein n=1 Tax=Acinetobacter ursingii TaxID=108980 RepID=UPI003AF881EC
MLDLIEIKSASSEPTDHSKSLQAELYEFLKKDRCHTQFFLFGKTVEVQLTGFPWQIIQSTHPCFHGCQGQAWGWNPRIVKGLGRFGGGWAIKFGITCDEKFRDFVIDLGIGSVRLEILRGFRA